MDDQSFGPRNLLELASNGTNHDPSGLWSLTKLVLLAGGTGDPVSTAGECIVECVEYEPERWTVFLEPLLAAAGATTPGERRAWWLSGAGARARGLARGGNFLILLENVRRQDEEAGRQSTTHRPGATLVSQYYDDTVTDTPGLLQLVRLVALARGTCNWRWRGSGRCGSLILLQTTGLPEVDFLSLSYVNASGEYTTMLHPASRMTLIV
eukprot:1191018-Prorocentrum_minimum.AAC.1